MLFNLFELVDMVVMTAVIGYLFHDTFRHPEKRRDVLERYQRPRVGGIEMQDFLWAAMLIAPTILLHELAHKFTALSFGLDATFHAACSSANLVTGAGFLDFYCGFTIVAVLLKAAGFGFFLFVPGFVSVSGNATYLQSAVVALAGPLVHLVFWLGAAHLLKDKRFVKRLSYKRRVYLFFFKQINMFLFILNMIPIPGFDGFNIIYNLIRGVFHI